MFFKCFHKIPFKWAQWRSIDGDMSGISFLFRTKSSLETSVKLLFMERQKSAQKILSNDLEYENNLPEI